MRVTHGPVSGHPLTISAQVRATQPGRVLDFSNDGQMPRIGQPGGPRKCRVRCPICRQRFYTRGKRGQHAQCPNCAELGLQVTVWLTGASSQEPSRALSIRQMDAGSPR